MSTLIQKIPAYARMTNTTDTLFKIIRILVYLNICVKFTMKISLKILDYFNVVLGCNFTVRIDNVRN